jgi:hypothetical protein
MEIGAVHGYSLSVKQKYRIDQLAQHLVLDEF